LATKDTSSTSVFQIGDKIKAGENSLLMGEAIGGLKIT
jgi:hypothetical protein